MWFRYSIYYVLATLALSEEPYILEYFGVPKWGPNTGPQEDF